MTAITTTIPNTPAEIAAGRLATIPGTSDIRVEGDCVHYLFSPPYPPSWINLDLRLLDKQLDIEKTYI